MKRIYDLERESTILCRFRWVVIFAAFLTCAYLHFFVRDSIEILTPVFYVLGGIALYNLVLLFLSRRVAAQGLEVFAFGQLLTDVFAATLLIFFTGGFGSPFLPLLLFPIIYAGFWLESPMVKIVAAAAVVATGLLLWLNYRLAPVRPSSDPVVTAFFFAVMIVWAYVLHKKTWLAEIILNALEEGSQRQIARLEEEIKKGRGVPVVAPSFERLQAPPAPKTEPLVATGRPAGSTVSTADDLRTAESQIEKKLQTASKRNAGLRADIERLRGKIETLVEKAAMAGVPENIGAGMKYIKLSLDRICAISAFEARCPVPRSSFDLRKVLIDVVGEMGPFAAERDVEILLNSETLEISSCPETVANVVRIFLDNAITYAARGTQVTVEARAGEGKFRIVVSDKGIGVEQDDAKKLFRKFFRGRDAMRRNPSGTGLSLYYAGLMVAELNGTVGFKSVPKKGSVFYAKIPLHDENATIERDAPHG